MCPEIALQVLGHQLQIYTVIRYVLILSCSCLKILFPGGDFIRMTGAENLCCKKAPPCFEISLINVSRDPAKNQTRFI